MTAAEGLLVLMWLGITAYALFGGADFGGGLWDLLAGGAGAGQRQRSLIAQAIGPIWEANHVWLIFVIVVLWTGFPEAFASVFSTLIVPLTMAGVGIILRGSSFAFRKEVPEVGVQQVFGATFAASSVLTPFFLGSVAGAVASGRVPVGNAEGDLVTSWLNPTSVLGGVLAVAVCGYLAAVYLTRDAQRHGHPDLVAAFRTRGVIAAVVVGMIAVAGIAVLRADAPALYDGLTGGALPLIVVSAVGGLGSVVLLLRGRYVWARVAAAVAVAAVIWGWAVGQHPEMLVGQLTIEEAAAGGATVRATFWSLVVGAALFVPPLVWLYVLFQRGERPESGPVDALGAEGDLS